MEKLIMIKLLLFFIGGFFVGNTMASTYLLTNEWFEERSKINLNSTINGLKKIPITSNPVVPFEVSGFSINDDSVFYISGSKKYEKIGSVKACNGLQGKCLVLNGMLKIFIPANFKNDTSSSWKWKDYYYSVNSRRKITLLGQALDITEIIAFCETCAFKVVRLDYDTSRGIVNIKLQSESAWITYMLSDSVGFLAN